MNQTEISKLRFSVGRDYREAPHGNENSIIEIMQGIQGILCIGRVHCGMGANEYELAQRVATLWAAAPDLLEALQAWASLEDEDLSVSGPEGADYIKEYAARLNTARAAIAKATGGQQ